MKPPFNLNTLQKLAYLKGLIGGDGCITGSRFELLCTEYIAEYYIKFFNSIEYNVNKREYKRTKGLFVLYKQNLDVIYLIKGSTYLGLERKWSQIPLVGNS